MPVWAISTGNEPLNGVVGFFFVHFMSMGWTPWQQVGTFTFNCSSFKHYALYPYQAIWLSEHLGPTIRNSAQRNVLIFGNDDQRYTYPSWFRKVSVKRNKQLQATFLRNSFEIGCG